MWNIIIRDMWKVISKTHGIIRMADSSMTGHEMDDNEIPKLLFYSTIFQGSNPPGSIISSLLVFLAKLSNT